MIVKKLLFSPSLGMRYIIGLNCMKMGINLSNPFTVLNTDLMLNSPILFRYVVELLCNTNLQRHAPLHIMTFI